MTLKTINAAAEFHLYTKTMKDSVFLLKDKKVSGKFVMMIKLKWKTSELNLYLELWLQEMFSSKPPYSLLNL